MSADLDLDLNIHIDTATAPPTISPPQNWTADTFLHHGFTIHQHKPQRCPPTASIPFVTLPDLAQNPSTFSNLFSLSQRAASALSLATYHAHISYPGHEPAAPNVDATLFQVSHLVKTILAILDRFEVKKVVALGVGIGATVFLKAAAERPQLFKGLILISPLIYPDGFAERWSTTMYGFLADNMQLSFSAHTNDRLWHRWLSDTTRDDPNSILTIEENMHTLNMHNALNFIRVDAFRESCEQLISQISCNLLLISGRASNLRHHSADSFAQFNAQKTSWLDVLDCGSLVHEEKVEDVVQAIDLFLKGLPL